MPFVMMCGLPCSGKTNRANKLRDHILENTKRTVHIISDQNFGVNKNEVYSDSRQEKELRGNLKSEVQRKISKDDVIILDSANYIKGFRYELFCVTKGCSTTQCVIHCDINPQVAEEWNQNVEEKDRYSKEVFDGLVMRFEPPDSRNRWDSSLFVLQPEDELPYDNISAALFQGKALPPNLSTQNQPLSSTNFLHELDKITQSTVNVILEAQKFGVPGDSVTIPGVNEKLLLTRHVTLAELQRLRRQFISFLKTHPVEETSRISSMFVQFIANGLH